jgi:hypothetical protein
MTGGGRTPAALCSLSGIGRNEDGSRNGKLHASLPASAEESHFSSTLNAFQELEMGVGLLFSSSIYQRACCHPVGSSSTQNTFPSTDFLFTNHRRRGCVPKPFLYLFVPSSLRGSSRARILPRKCTSSIRANSKHTLVRDQ